MSKLHDKQNYIVTINLSSGLLDSSVELMFLYFHLTAVLAAAAPEIAPFMADECLMAIPDTESIDYTVKEYLKYVQNIRTVVDRLNAEGKNSAWSPHRVELALWAHYIVRKLEPSLLDDIPEIDSPVQNGDSNKSSENVTNGSQTGDSFLMNSLNHVN